MELTRIKCVVLSVLQVAAPVVVFAQTAPVQPEEIAVRVRAIEAFNDLPESQDAALKMGNDEGLIDIRPKLKKLKYRNFALLSSQRKLVKYDSTELMELGEGHVLRLKPIYKKGKKVCLWLQWKDGTGMEVLNTQMHFKAAESMLTGVDKSEEKGLVLAIDVE